MVTCKTCGMLAQKKYDTKATIEVEQRTRDDGATGTPANADLFCYMASSAFPKRPSKRSDEQQCSHEVLVLRQISTEIECDLWRQYRKGKSPKEHEEMTILDRVAAENRAEQAASRAEQAAFQSQEIKAGLTSGKPTVSGKSRLKHWQKHDTKSYATINGNHHARIAG